MSHGKIFPVHFVCTQKSVHNFFISALLLFTTWGRQTTPVQRHFQPQLPSKLWKWEALPEIEPLTSWVSRESTTLTIPGMSRSLPGRSKKLAGSWPLRNRSSWEGPLLSQQWENLCKLPLKSLNVPLILKKRSDKKSDNCAIDENTA